MEALIYKGFKNRNQGNVCIALIDRHLFLIGGEVEMIIVDMPMPENCHDCPFNTGEYGVDYYEKCSCDITRHQMTKRDYKKRPTDCPLHEQ